MPTLRQQLVVQKISENIRNSGFSKVSIGQILREAGYSNSVSLKPQLVTQSKNFQTLMERTASPVHQFVAFQHLYLITQMENLSIKVRALDMYYKMTGAYTRYKTGGCPHCPHCNNMVGKDGL